MLTGRGELFGVVDDVSEVLVFDCPEYIPSLYFELFCYGPVDFQYPASVVSTITTYGKSSDLDFEGWMNTAVYCRSRIAWYSWAA